MWQLPTALSPKAKVFSMTYTALGILVHYLLGLLSSFSLLHPLL